MDKYALIYKTGVTVFIKITPEAHKELLAQIAGTAEINATPAPLGVLTGMVAEKAITKSKTALFEVLIDQSQAKLLAEYIDQHIPDVVQSETKENTLSPIGCK